jgi:cytochrome c553
MKPRLIKAAGLLLVLAVAGFLVAASGVMPIKASSGHWPITEWFLHFAMRRSISFHTLGLEAPSLDNSQAVLKGAGHYETGCRPCHGSPGERLPKIAQGMTPFPPYLPPQVTLWQPEELFYIVKHGVKFTGMPAWPTQQRDDEVWTMVAFLLTLPTLDGHGYHQLVHGDTDSSRAGVPIQQLSDVHAVSTSLLANCARCHGPEGSGRGVGVFPKLAGQRAGYLTAALQAYAHGERHSGLMQPIASGLRPEEISGLAHYYSTLPLPSSPRSSQQPSSAVIERGKKIATHGIPSRGVPACLPCHDPARTYRNPVYPELAGQHAEYLVLQLELFQQRRRGGSAYAHLMQPTANRLTPEQMRDVAAYFESVTVQK